MPRLPLLREVKLKRAVTERFLGYNHNMKIGAGEFYHMENMSSDNFPLLSSRSKRGLMQSLKEPGGIAAKSEPMWIDEGRLYMNGRPISGDTIISPGEKTMVSMGAYLLIFPDKLYFNCENPEDKGSIEAFYESSGAVDYSLCSLSGAEYGEAIVSETEPENPKNGQLWIDSSKIVHSLKQYSSASEMWAEPETVYTKISAIGIGRDFSERDAVEIEGCQGSEQILSLNGTKLIEKRGEDFILVQGMLSQAYSQTEGTVKISRKMPDMDFLTEAENRLWGCKYGLVEGKTVNEIYACALGDFKNWNRFQGIADDSYRASVGTDGPFTAACTHLGYPLFFKENALHKVYISSSGAHRIADTACRGVEQGSHKSLAAMGEKLFYKSSDRICLYEGSIPRGISQALGDISYHGGIGGCMGDKYYISMLDEKQQSHLFAYDSLRGLWHREDDLRPMGFAGCGKELYCIDETGRLIAMGGSQGAEEEDFHFSAQSGLMGYSQTEHKYIGRLILRLRLPIGSEANVYIQYDSDGSWIKAGQIQGRGTGSFSLPLRPRRCDHFRLKITGSGQFRLYSIVKIIESGSDY